MPRLVAILVFMTFILPTHAAKKCTVLGNADGPAAGLSVSQPTTTSQCASCGPYTYWDSSSMDTYKKFFPQAMSLKVEAHTGKCVCYTGKDETNRAAEVVKYFAMSTQAAEECKGVLSEGEKTWTKEAHQMCWKMYGRIRGELAAPKTHNTWTSSGKAIVIKSHAAPWSEKDFRVECDRSGPACEGDECYTIVLPSTIDGMDDKRKEWLKDLVKQSLAGKDIGEDQIVVDALLDPEICALMDTDDSGDISVDELADMYEGEKKEDVKKWVKEVQEKRSEEKKEKASADGIDGIRCDELTDFKDAMREDKAKDKVMGIEDMISLQPVVKAEKAKWQATEVECFKGTKSVDPIHCHPGWAAVKDDPKEAEKLKEAVKKAAAKGDDQQADAKESACEKINTDCT